MSQLTAIAKRHILLEYRPRSPTHSFAALARAHGVAGGADVVRHWHDRWDGTPFSLQHKQGAGRPRKLSRTQVSRHVKPRILAANRRHEAVHYTDILSAVQDATASDLSLRTLQRYGKQQLGVKAKRGKKRTADESKSTHIHNGVQMRMCVACALTDKSCHIFVSTVSVSFHL
jgi:transposase